MTPAAPTEVEVPLSASDAEAVALVDAIGAALLDWKDERDRAAAGGRTASTAPIVRAILLAKDIVRERDALRALPDRIEALAARYESEAPTVLRITRRQVAASLRAALLAETGQ